MNTPELKALIQLIVSQTQQLKDAHTTERNAPVNYCAIFSQSQKEYSELLAAANQLGKIVEQTPTGPHFHIAPLETTAGKLLLLKIRVPDKTRPERGDADFTVANYAKFKKKHLGKSGFKLIKRETHEMIELIDPKFNVRAYFSNPPLDKLLGLK